MSVTGRALVVAALICLAASSGCAGTTEGGGVPVAGSSTADLRDEAVRVAEQAAVALTSMARDDGGAGYDRLRELLTDPARQQWEQQRAERLATIEPDAVTSDSVVTASGVAALDSSAMTATVLVAVIATVSTNPAVSTNPNPTTDELRYRLQLSLTRTPAGWKVSQLRFVE